MENNDAYKAAIDWFKALNPHQRIAIKELSAEICGIRWEDIILILSQKERISFLYDKILSIIS